MAKKIPLPKVKAQKMHWLDKLFTGIGGLSALINHPNVYRGFEKRTESGLRNIRDLRAARIAKYGKWGMRGARASMGLLNPWTAVPVALTGLAKYAVDRSFAPYKDEEGNWSAEGLERMSQERMEREARARASAAKRAELAWMDDPEFRMWGGGLKASKIADHPDIATKYGYNMNEGGIARLV